MTQILIADDQPDIRNLIRRSLELDANLGSCVEILEAANGVSALETCRLHKPDLVVLDVMMPGPLDGLMVLDAIRLDPVMRHSRVIMVTARGQASDIEIGMQRGADAYFTKPFSPLQLVACIKETLLKAR